MSVELIEVATGDCLWGDHFRCHIKDIFETQEELTRRITSALQLPLTLHHEKLFIRPERHTENKEAYHLYLKGRYLWAKRTTESLRQSVECFEAACQLDDGFAAAYAGCAAALCVMGIYSMIRPRDAFPRAWRAADRALAIRPETAEGHVSQAHVKWAYEHAWDAGEEKVLRALRIDPANALVRQWYGEFLSTQGRFDEAFEQIGFARELDPLSLSVNTAAGHIYYQAGRYRDAADQYMRTLDIEPNHVQGHLHLGLSLLHQGFYGEAADECTKALELDQNNNTGRAIFRYVCEVGKNRVGTQLKAVKTLDPLPQGYISPYHLAMINTARNRLSEAVINLEQAYAENSGLLCYLDVEPSFRPLRRLPRFRTLLERLNFSTAH